MNSWTARDMNHNKLAIKISSLYLTPGKPLNYPQCPIILTPQHLDSGREEEARLHSRQALRGAPKVSKESYSTFQPDGWSTGLPEPGVGLMFWFELDKYDVCNMSSSIMLWKRRTQKCFNIVPTCQKVQLDHKTASKPYHKTYSQHRHLSTCDSSVGQHVTIGQGWAIPGPERRCPCRF